MYSFWVSKFEPKMALTNIFLKLFGKKTLSTSTSLQSGARLLLVLVYVRHLMGSSMNSSGQQKAVSRGPTAAMPVKARLVPTCLGIQTSVKFASIAIKDTYVI